MTSVPPSAAPPDTPSTNGSARAFRSRAWSATPAPARAAPTMAARSALRQAELEQDGVVGLEAGERRPERDRLGPDGAGEGER